jgi:hypothetical protein
MRNVQLCGGNCGMHMEKKKIKSVDNDLHNGFASKETPAMIN